MTPYNDIMQAINKLNLDQYLVNSFIKLASALDHISVNGVWGDAINTRFLETACLALGIDVPDFCSIVWERYPLPSGAKMPGHVLRVAIIAAAGLEPK